VSLNKGNLLIVWQTINQDVRELMRSPDQETLVHAIMGSGHLPATQKQFERVADDLWATSNISFETTAGALRLILVNLYSNPAVLERLRNELAAASAKSSKVLDLDALEKLPYLTAVIMEGLRLSPGVATRGARVAPDRDLMYRDQRIPAGTPVGMTTLLLHTDPDMYPNPHSYDPARWLDPDPWHIGDRVFAPFSQGTRACLGLQ
jgi:cytochrome P450